MPWPRSVSIELIHADGVAVRNNGPIVGVAIDAGDLVRGKLKYLERYVRPFQRAAGR